MCLDSVCAPNRLQVRAADMLLFGRVTYEGMAAHWKTAQVKWQRV
jgi:hypothetical protein